MTALVILVFSVRSEDAEGVRAALDRVVEHAKDEQRLVRALAIEGNWKRNVFDQGRFIER